MNGGHALDQGCECRSLRRFERIEANMNLKVIRKFYGIFKKKSINHNEWLFRNCEKVVIFIMNAQVELLDLK